MITFFKDDNGYKYLIIESQYLEEQIQYCIENRIVNLYISWYNGFHSDSVEFIDRINLKRLIINPYKIKSLTAINNQHELVFLGINSDPVNQEIDFNNFKKLEVFRGIWTKKLKNLFDCKSLKVLWLWKLKSKANDLSELAGLEKLIEIRINQSSIINCNGIGELKSLKKVGLAYNKYLESFLGEKKVNQIEEIEIEMCKKIDLNSLKVLCNLKQLRIINNGNIVSLEPLLKYFPFLVYLQYTEGDLNDGDNLYLLKQPSLKEVWLSDKKHYRFKTKQINDALKSPDLVKSLLNSYRTN